MPDYRRWYVKGGTYFFTLVTHERRPIFHEVPTRVCLRKAIHTIQETWQFQLFAAVLMPDHLHCIWSLPRRDDSYSKRRKLTKAEFTIQYLASGGIEGARSASREKQGERGIWQRRFWEHTVQDEDDLTRCVDYIHWNPRKHGYVDRVRDWEWSSFRQNGTVRPQLERERPYSRLRWSGMGRGGPITLRAPSHQLICCSVETSQTPNEKWWN